MIILWSSLYSQEILDARMLGLNGTYTNLASGHRAVGIYLIFLWELAIIFFQ